MSTSAALLLHLAEDGPDTVLDQEPWIAGGKISKKQLSIFLLHNYSDANSTSASMQFQTTSIQVLSSKPPNELVEKKAKDSERLNIKGFEFNAHHTL